MFELPHTQARHFSTQGLWGAVATAAPLGLLLAGPWRALLCSAVGLFWGSNRKPLALTSHQPGPKPWPLHLSTLCSCQPRAQEQGSSQGMQCW